MITKQQANFLDYIESVDRNASLLLHQLDTKSATLLLYPFARLFNPQWIIFPILLISLLAQISFYPNWKPGLLFALFYALIGIEFNLFITLLTKKIFGRKRPHFDEEKFKNKPKSFRARENNCSMPSGDSMQSANFLIAVAYLLINYSGSNEIMMFVLYNWVLLGTFMLAMQVLVACGRVYFMCHYFGDTVVGTILGVLNAKFLYFTAFQYCLLLFKKLL